VGPTTIVGYVFLQGRTNHSGIAVEVSGPGGVFDLTTGADGQYKLIGADEGAYEFLFEHDLYLATRLRNCAIGEGAELRPPSMTLAAGDLNRDQRIDILDLTRCQGALGTADPGADINADGIVDIVDMTLLGLNLNTVGPIQGFCP
jgi:hypothetical protein